MRDVSLIGRFAGANGAIVERSQSAENEWVIRRLVLDAFRQNARRVWGIEFSRRHAQRISTLWISVATFKSSVR
jgi:hypothetical protein